MDADISSASSHSRVSHTVASVSIPCKVHPAAPLNNRIC